MESAQRERLELAGLEWERFTGERGNARFELSLILEETGDDVRGEIEYDADLFDEQTVVQMSGYLHTVLEQMVTHPEGGVADTPLAGPQESLDLSLGFSADLEA
jgi:non-ribosomal peptide synthetase component F